MLDWPDSVYLSSLMVYVYNSIAPLWSAKGNTENFVYGRSSVPRNVHFSWRNQLTPWWFCQWNDKEPFVFAHEMTNPWLYKMWGNLKQRNCNKLSIVIWSGWQTWIRAPHTLEICASALDLSLFIWTLPPPLSISRERANRGMVRVSDTDKFLCSQWTGRHSKWRWRWPQRSGASPQTLRTDWLLSRPLRRSPRPGWCGGATLGGHWARPRPCPQVKTNKPESLRACGGSRIPVSRSLCHFPTATPSPASTRSGETPTLISLNFLFNSTDPTLWGVKRGQKYATNPEFHIIVC